PFDRRHPGNSEGEFFLIAFAVLNFGGRFFKTALRLKSPMGPLFYAPGASEERNRSFYEVEVLPLSP
ncbi:MAG: hypothetical protein M3O82_08320, partial [Verrucomicrobiota bacterium]|nr:hypothetical protein [Verrucomicrobiota bacterium]